MKGLQIPESLDLVGLAEKPVTRRGRSVYVETYGCQMNVLDSGLVRDQLTAAGYEVASSVDESLQRLRTDHLDLLIVHDVEFGDERQVVEETIPAALAMKETGKVRFAGIPNFAPELFRRARLHSRPPAPQ